MEAAAQRTRTRYYALRLTTVVGAVIVPALVSINALGGAETAITWLTFAVSLVVAVSAAVEGFFRFGDRWRHYRSLVEELKSEGWDFHELSGPTGRRRDPQDCVSRLRRPGERRAQARDAGVHRGDRKPAAAGDAVGRGGTFRPVGPLCAAVRPATPPGSWPGREGPARGCSIQSG